MADQSIPDIFCIVPPKALRKRAHVLEPSCVPTRLFQPVTSWRLVLAAFLIQVGSKRFKRSTDGTTPAADMLSLMHSISLRAADGGLWMDEFCDGPLRGGSSAEANLHQ
ncbi:hypothetical protein AZE42_04856 [Rhizopogon vesiculosus]|uniref:Uncharacterized protein n=1 Tax=Rhizopogon vesiculosus TaxID=180088 RepID=A0A1J8R7M1_9AGAM|nr:hypothetical protein AZE42_04856 [Rhizopogon vesiculosus]